MKFAGYFQLMMKPENKWFDNIFKIKFLNKMSNEIWREETMNEIFFFILECVVSEGVEILRWNMQQKKTQEILQPSS